ncbi:PREDICTED: uncharacterized protein LOC106107115 [Papilio polytes]|uniref:uncharacterized protein LOC106107115 n=1 Tax=Papilio polytes TaxID=76194 RepID=UPI0006766E84|nr:PREDICTED: uncharacterized protein LOC106107115 [Papilio polytes]
MNFIKTRGPCTTFLSCSNPDRPLTRSNLLNRIGINSTSNSMQKPFIRTGLINLPSKSPRPMVQSIESRPRFNCSPRIERGNISARKVPSENLRLKNKFSCKINEKSNINQSLQNVSLKKVVAPVNEQNIPEKQTIRRSQIETLKNTFCREVHDISPLPNTSSASGKRYKPQLEDIKSSYLLLNKKNVIDRNIENIISNDCQNRVVSKPEPFDEMKRREQLIKAREKYKSKKYWNESKYRCIEGLNWISWK